MREEHPPHLGVFFIKTGGNLAFFPCAVKIERVRRAVALFRKKTLSAEQRIKARKFGVLRQLRDSEFFAFKGGRGVIESEFFIIRDNHPSAQFAMFRGIAERLLNRAAIHFALFRVEIRA